MVDYSLKMTTFARNIKIRIKAIKKNMAQEDVFKKIVSHCKEYGFVFPSSEIYDGLGAVIPKYLSQRLRKVSDTL